MQYKNTFDMLDRVITPLGKGTIINKPHGENGDCNVKLDEPLNNGDSQGQRIISTNTFQLKHIE